MAGLGENMAVKRLALLLALTAWLAPLAAAPAAVDDAFKKFWDATNPKEAAAAVADVVGAGVAFDDALARLKQGRTYSPTVPRGIVPDVHRLALGEYWYTVEVPQDYDPARRYQVRVQLHGGVMGRQTGTIRGTGGIGALAGVDQIYVMPMAWNEAPWWTDFQVENLRAILDTVKRKYNVDENRITLAGVSDGATGTYYFAMRDTTPFASFAALNGSLGVLQNPTIGRNGALFPQNLVNKPYFIVNGGLDPLYPTELVEPYIRHIRKKGVEVLYHPQPEGVHNTMWWPDEKDAFETFVHDHPRQPIPERLSWESDLAGDVNRAHWLVIDALMDKADTREPLSDVNIFSSGPGQDFGAQVDGLKIKSLIPGSAADTFGFFAGDVVTSINGQAPPAGQDLLDWFNTFDPRKKLTVGLIRDRVRLELIGSYDPDGLPPLPLFPHRQFTGRVDLVRAGNTVTATTRGVAAFTLLLSPDAFDFAKPVKVVADGKTVFEGAVKKNLETLMKWAARDNDRTMLFGAELSIRLPQ